MGDSTKLAGALPKGDADGLGVITTALVEEPHRYHVALVILDGKSVTTNFDTVDVVPTARIRRIEVVLGQDLDTAEQLMRRALEDRTGRSVLPLNLEDDVRLAFGQVDPRTGERHGDGEPGR